MQTVLFQPAFDPIVDKAHHYVPALQTKIGELTALAHLSLSDWRAITPLVQVLGPKSKGEGYTKSSINNWMKKVSAAVGTNDCFLDVIRFDPCHSVKDWRGGTAIDFLYTAARRRNIKFIPVYNTTISDARYLSTIRESAIFDGRGVALRLILDVIPSGQNRSDYICELLRSLEIECGNVDLIVDFRCLDSDSERPARLIRRLFNELSAIGEWRNIIVLATAMPSTLACVKEGTVGEIARLEWEMWQDIRASQVDRLPVFGDYAVQNPSPPSDKGGPGMRANIRYTADEFTLIARGYSVLEEGAEQYRDLCRRITSHVKYSGPDYTWGDRQILDCADGVIEPGGQDMWRGVATSHHLHLVSDAIATS